MAKPIITLDAGHGLKTSGKRCLKKLDPKETREWYLNDRIMDKVQEKLKSYDCTVLRVDDTTGAKDISLANRVKQANNGKADIYISMHHNAGLNGKSGGGTVVYYCSSKPARRQQAERLYNAITYQTGLIGNRSEKVINKGFYVIKKTTMPAFLVENGFMDSPTDVPIILSESHAEKTANGVIAFLVSELKLQEKKKTSVTNKKYFPKYDGEKTKLVNALSRIGVDNTLAYRKKIAKANGISGYTGTSTQNVKIYNLLVAGMLLRP